MKKFSPTISLVRSLLVSVFVFLLVVMIGGKVKGSSQPITVIAAFNLTGTEAVLDKPCYDGAQLAMTKINAAGGVLGHRLELIPVDMASNLQETAKKTEEALKSHPEAIAGIGFSYSTYALEAGQKFQAANLPFITPGATAPDLPEKVGDNMFLAAYGDDAQAQVMANFAWEQLGLRRVALWIDDSRVYTRTVGRFFDESFRQLGGGVEKSTYPEGTSNFQPWIETFLASDPQPQAIYAASQPSDSVPIIEQVREAGIQVPLLSGDGWADEEMIKFSQQKGLQDIYFTTHRFLGVDTPPMKAFVESYKKTFGSVPPNAFAPLGFDTVNLLANAITRANSLNPELIRQVLAKTSNFPGLVGQISYKPGTRVPDKAVAVVRVNKGVKKPMGTWFPPRVTLLHQPT